MSSPPRREREAKAPREQLSLLATAHVWINLPASQRGPSETGLNRRAAGDYA
jgi:hypothetical protein